MPHSLLGRTSDSNVCILNADTYSLLKLTSRLTTMRETDAEASVQFDKDDSETLDFVTATANLRAHVYGIEEKSRFQVKGTD